MTSDGPPEPAVGPAHPDLGPATPAQAEPEPEPEPGLERVLEPGPVVSLLSVIQDDVDGVRDQVMAMVRSNYPALEVIVVDDASGDGSADVLFELALELGITVVLHEVRRGRARCLRAAADRASGEVLAVADPGMVLPDDAVDSAVGPLLAGRARGTVRWRSHGVTAHLAVPGRAALRRAAGG